MVTLSHDERMMFLGHCVAKIYYYEIYTNSLNSGLNGTELLMHNSREYGSHNSTTFEEVFNN